MHGLTVSLPPYVLLGAIGLAAALATYLGGSLALKAQSRLRLILGFSAGAVIAVALFDLLPEALDLARPRPDREVFGFAAAGFCAYMLLDRALQALSGGGRQRGHLGPAALTVHSALDGLGIGLAFHVSTSTGIVLALAVLAHDFADGVNTVSLSLSGKASKAARAWLIADSLAPLFGIAAAQLIRVGQAELALFLAAFSGVFLYIGASELIPESHQRHPRLWTSLATMLGMALIYAAVRLAGH
jgi:zinc transporter ZupT